jgi:hypothetical protein
LVKDAISYLGIDSLGLHDKTVGRVWEAISLSNPDEFGYNGSTGYVVQGCGICYSMVRSRDEMSIPGHASVVSEAVRLI